MPVAAILQGIQIGDPLVERLEALHAVERQEEPLIPSQVSGLEKILLISREPEIKTLAKKLLETHPRTQDPAKGPVQKESGDMIGPDPWFKRANRLRDLRNDISQRLRASPGTAAPSSDEIAACVWITQNDPEPLVRKLAQEILKLC